MDRLPSVAMRRCRSTPQNCLANPNLPEHPRTMCPTCPAPMMGDGSIQSRGGGSWSGRFTEACVEE
jgi:hypothetical protein